MYRNNSYKSLKPPFQARCKCISSLRVWVMTAIRWWKNVTGNWVRGTTPLIPTLTLRRHHFLTHPTKLTQHILETCSKWGRGEGVEKNTTFSLHPSSLSITSHLHFSPGNTPDHFQLSTLPSPPSPVHLPLTHTLPTSPPAVHISLTPSPPLVYHHHHHEAISQPFMAIQSS